MKFFWKYVNTVENRIVKNGKNTNQSGGARGVIVIVVENTSSNPGRDWLHFTSH